jgi:hypothetical protein
VAPPGADIAKNEERRRAGIPTFPPIRATGLLTDGVKIKLFERLLDFEIIRTGSRINLKPGREPRLAGIQWQMVDG